MVERIKKIVSEYTKISIDQLHFETQIGRSVVGNSIILHRMYAAIAKEGIEIPRYQEINTFGELINKIPGSTNSGDPALYNPKIISAPVHLFHQGPGVGIDIEEISKMPRVIDFREDEFYTMNFTPEEIAYCILQPDQYASFTGLFAAKEAIVKADNNYKKIAFNKIFVDHLSGGQPVFQGFSISVSHAQNFSVAIAIKNFDLNNIHSSDQKGALINGNNHSSLWISIVTIILALIAICITLFR